MIAENIVRNVQDEGEDWVNETEEVHRLGNYTEGGARPLKVKFRAQTTASEVILHAWRLAKVELYKNVWIKRDMNEEYIGIHRKDE